jgi:hypothetical protein
VNTEETQRKPWQAIAIYIGIALIGVSCILSMATAVGLFALDTFEFVGHSGLRSLAGLAVSGCVTAAIGFWDE